MTVNQRPTARTTRKGAAAKSAVESTAKRPARGLVKGAARGSAGTAAQHAVKQGAKQGAKGSAKAAAKAFRLVIEPAGQSGPSQAVLATVSAFQRGVSRVLRSASEAGQSVTVARDGRLVKGVPVKRGRAWQIEGAVVLGGDTASPAPGERHAGGGAARRAASRATSR